MPDAKTMGRWGLVLGPQVLKQIHDRIVKIARDKGSGRGNEPMIGWDDIQALCAIYFHENGVPDNLSPLINNMLTLWGSRISKAAPVERTMRRYVTRWAAAWLRVQPK